MRPFDPRVDTQATLGLAGGADSLAYRIEEIEKHFHARERWFGMLAVQTATDWADDNITTPFQAISGNGAYGSDANDEAQVIGTDDTPVITGSAYYDPHRIYVTDASSLTIYKLRLVYGSGTMANAITAGQTSEYMVSFNANTPQIPAIAVDIMCPRLVCGTDKVWIQAWNATDNATIDFFVGLHEYAG